MTRDERERGERLRAFCDAVAGKPVDWGIDDCSAWVLQWVVNETRQEVDWPAYSTRAEAEAKIADEGGLEAIWTRMARDLRLIECHEEAIPVGSVGLLNVETWGGPVGVIFAHGNVVCWRHEQGVRVFGVRRWASAGRATIVKVWTV
jgi:hypothetical protein